MRGAWRIAYTGSRMRLGAWRGWGSFRIWWRMWSGSAGGGSAAGGWGWWWSAWLLGPVLMRPVPLGRVPLPAWMRARVMLPQWKLGVRGERVGDSVVVCGDVGLGECGVCVVRAGVGEDSTR